MRQLPAAQQVVGIIYIRRQAELLIHMHMHPPRIRLGILDSHPLVLKGLTAIIDKCIDVEVIGTFDDSADLLDTLSSTRVDVILLEYFLDSADQDGAELIPILRRRHPGARIVIFSASQDPGIAALALRLGAHGFVSKSSPEDVVLNALRRVHAGGQFIDPAIRHLLPDSLLPIYPVASHDAPADQRIKALLDSAKLSPSERIVVKTFVSGINVMEIAARLQKSPKTVSTQKAAAFRKLGVSSDSGLYRLISSTAEPY